MELKRKQRALRQKFWFRVGVCAVSLAGVVLYLGLNNDSALWGTVIGICGSALVWALVEIFDFFIQTAYQYESERNMFWRIKSECFGKMKTIIRQSPNEIPMHDINTCAVELYDRTNEFIFSASVYPISCEFEKCTNYIERMFWKFDACCSKMFRSEAEKSLNYRKMHESLIEKTNDNASSVQDFFDLAAFMESLSETTDIPLCFEKYTIPAELFEDGPIGNLGESFSLFENVRTLTTFKPDKDFWPLFSKKHANTFCTVSRLIFRKVNL